MKFLKKFGAVLVFVVFLFGCAETKIFTYRDLGMGDEKTRSVSVKVVVDEEYREKNKNWKEKVVNLMSGTSTQFEQQFKIRLALKEIKEWNLESDNSNRMLMLHEVKRKFPITPEIDIVVAFTNQKTNYLWWVGTAEHLGNYALVGVSSDDFFEKRIITHEIGHLFGAIDYDGYHGSPYSVMNYDFFKETDYFDEKNARIIMKNKWRNFH